MNQADLVQRLDEAFSVAAYDERDLWHAVLSPADRLVYEAAAEPEFINGTWNGLMLNNTAEIDRVYLLVFPDEQALDVVLASELERGAPGALIFAHHPADLDETGVGFKPIHEAQLEALREHAISYYCCHAPLDCHAEVSTVAALAKALKVYEPVPFGPHRAGLEGLYGRVRDQTFASMAEMAARVTELPILRYNQVRFNGQPVERVAVIPGGGDDPAQLRLARDLGCDTFITGSWWPLGTTEYAAERRRVLSEVIPSLEMNLIGTSHYASEMVVMRDLLPGWFRNAGIEARLVRQTDPWR